MANQPPKEKSSKDKKDLTEWQKRNLDFLKQKEIEKKEQEKLQKDLVALKRRTLQSKEKIVREAEATSKPSQGRKGGRGRQRRPRPANHRPVAGKKVATKPQAQKKAIHTRTVKFRRRMASILVPAIIGIVLSIFFMTPFSKLKHFQVEGAKQTDSQSVVKAAGVRDEAYTISTVFDRNQIEQNIKTNDPWVKSVSIGYTFPITFTIKVKEYSIIGYAQTDQGYVPVLESGKRLDSVTASGLPDRFTTINLGNGKYLDRLIKSLTKMDKSLIKKIKVISLADSKTTKDLLKLEMYDGNTVYVPLSEIEKKLPYYPKVKKKLKGNTVVDMEVGIYATSDSNDTETSESTETGDEAENQQESEAAATTEEQAASVPATETPAAPEATEESSQPSEAATPEAGLVEPSSETEGQVLVE